MYAKNQYVPTYMYDDVKDGELIGTGAQWCTVRTVVVASYTGYSSTSMTYSRSSRSMILYTAISAIASFRW